MENESLTITDTEIVRELAVLITLSDGRTIVLTLNDSVLDEIGYCVD